MSKDAGAKRREFLKFAATGAASAVGVTALTQQVSAQTAVASEFNVRRFGAKADGTTIDTPAITAPSARLPRLAEALCFFRRECMPVIRSI